MLTGDFVLALIRDSKDLDGYAFALGALAHYAADNEGHRIGVNRAEPLLYPKLKEKYGNTVTYERAHLETEFGFDVLQVARAAMRLRAITTSSVSPFPHPCSSRLFKKLTAWTSGRPS